VTHQPGAPVSVIDPPDSGPVSSLANCSGGDCRNTPVMPQIMAANAKAAKPNFVMGRNPTRRAD
jgi:hypothetical protein